ncbi:MAG: ABC transporter ATP-binding protein [Chloroflexota bacterium]|nr:MAG: ABC transporter ATP-binding protein [Chloroflexota bacterium]
MAACSCKGNGGSQCFPGSPFHGPPSAWLCSPAMSRSGLPARSKLMERTSEVSERSQSRAATSDAKMFLNVKDLKIGVRTSGVMLPVVDAANLSVDRNAATGIVGESGSGKTMLCRALIGTLSRRGAVLISGSMLFEGRELAGAPESVWKRIRGREIGYVPQSSLAGLNPVLTIGTQLIEAIMAMEPANRVEAERTARELLELVRIPRAKLLLEEHPHQLSGGMRQRVMIAAALAQRPKLLIADEPTTALDVTIQREILTLMAGLRRDLGMSLILVSHDLAVIEEVCDSVMVMYAGASVEVAPVEVLRRAPQHPYTRALRSSRVDTATPGQDLDAPSGEPVAVGAWPEGCRFAPRCALVDQTCQRGPQPPLMGNAHQSSACIRAEPVEDTW